ncbi:MAG: hypothetical protein ACXAEF_12270 [Candidatus Thorarchaeota archaeon]|jgi:hypothetical protein
MNKKKTRLIAASLAFCFVVCALSVGMVALMAGTTASVFADGDALDHKTNEPQVYADPDAQDFRTNTEASNIDPAILPHRLVTLD